ncbi:hypothetical protein GCM10009804_75230 [Kribbella hippodromi]|uniref:Uncharacterized protein n=1 Tax=Kribbella hippodromi TaxID=434347 RepID=A0ABN2ELJ9_9ACTN
MQYGRGACNGGDVRCVLGVMSASAYDTCGARGTSARGAMRGAAGLTGVCGVVGVGWSGMG